MPATHEALGRKRKMEIFWGIKKQMDKFCNKNNINGYLRSHLNSLFKSEKEYFRDDCHFIPQSDYFLKAPSTLHFNEDNNFLKNVKINKFEILHFENLQESYPLLLEKYGIKKHEMLKVLPGNREDNILKDKCQFEKYGNRTTSEMVELLDSQTIQIINDVYSRDFEMFGYEKTHKK